MEDKRKNLEGMLKEIQGLKSEKYIGTGEAWNYLKRVRALYENPQRVANAINEFLGSEAPYKATPERILGVCETYHDYIKKKVMKLAPEIHGEATELYSVYNALFDLPQFQPFRDLVYEENMGPFIDSLKFPFSVVNMGFSQGETDSARAEFFFGYGVMAAALRELEDTYSQESLDSVYEDVPVINWDYYTSGDYFKKIESDYRKHIYINEINISDRITRMQRDLVDHRLENRREIITDLIHSEEFKSYEHMVAYVEWRLRMREKRLKELKYMNMPDVVIDDRKKMFEEYVFIRRLVGSDKNFIQRYLKQ
jgi:hypothetical protein